MENNSERIEKLLALLLIETMKSQSQAEKIRLLNIAGFTNTEIADILDTNAAVVAVRLSESRKTKKRRKK